MIMESSIKIEGGLFHVRNFSMVRIKLTGVILEGDVGEAISQNCPTSPFLKFREKWFYIGYIERIF